MGWLLDPYEKNILAYHTTRGSHCQRRVEQAAGVERIAN
jgi:hypothetical protein